MIVLEFIIGLLVLATLYAVLHGVGLVVCRYIMNEDPIEPALPYPLAGGVFFINVFWYSFNNLAYWSWNH